VEEHPGYIDYRTEAEHIEALGAQADHLLASFDAEGEGKQLFVVLPPYAYRIGDDSPIVVAHTAIADCLMQALERRGFAEIEDSEWMRRSSRLGVRVYRLRKQ
jgi:hypothetical protein